jgi:antitoxin component YwqK of YwqJK toxin-antitoxin module
VPFLIALLAFSGDDLREIAIPPDAVGREAVFRPLGAVASKKRYRVGGEIVGERLFYRDGQLADERLYRNKKLHGIWRQFHPNGQLFAERPHRDGQMDGTFRFWDEDGNLLGESVMKSGTGLLREFGKPELQSDDAETHYVGGEMHGLRTRWGRFQGCRGLGYSISEYKRGTLDGWVVTRDEDGTLVDFGRMRGNKSHGVQRKFASDGSPAQNYPKYYINGDDVSEARFLDSAKTDKLLGETLIYAPPRTEEPPAHDKSPKETPENR